MLKIRRVYARINEIDIQMILYIVKQETNKGKFTSQIFRKMWNFKCTMFVREFRTKIKKASFLFQKRSVQSCFISTYLFHRLFKSYPCSTKQLNLSVKINVRFSNRFIIQQSKRFSCEPRVISILLQKLQVKDFHRITKLSLRQISYLFGRVRLY